ncbi:hypothetical protein [Salinicola halimionae]|uniref:hypothetical protein n=1 Tax=Salinicola halimionae TaxID=1949081 RepID=UPI0013006232|nr:hypothetical protein [Salinicola halimionae]
MNNAFWQYVIPIISMLIGATSIFYAIYTKRQMSKIEDHRIKNLRSSLKRCISVMGKSFRLTQNSEQYSIHDKEAIRQISCIHTTSLDLIRDLFQDLSELDSPYDTKKLNFYTSSGIITSKWVWEQAAMFVLNDSTIEMPPNLPENTIDWVTDTIETVNS